MTDHVEIDVPLWKGKPPLTHNQRLHRMEEARRTKIVREAVGWSAKALKLGHHRHITVQLHYRPGDNKRRDAPNLTATSKPAIDGLVDAGLVHDDNDDYVTEIMPTIHRGQGQPRRLWLAITITEETETVREPRGEREHRAKVHKNENEVINGAARLDPNDRSDEAQQIRDTAADIKARRAASN